MRCRGGIVTKAGVVLIAVLVGGLLFSWAMTGPREADTLVALPEAQAVDDGMGRSLQARIRQEAERQTLEAAARARAELERRQACGRRGDGSAPDGVGDAEHRSLDPRRERGRVGALGRRFGWRSWSEEPARSVPFPWLSRTGIRTRPRSRPKPAPAMRPTRMWPLLENTVQAALASFEQSVGALENELEAGLAGEQLSPRVPWHRRCCGARVRAASLPSGTEPDSARA